MGLTSAGEFAGLAGVTSHDQICLGVRSQGHVERCHADVVEACRLHFGQQTSRRLDWEHGI